MDVAPSEHTSTLGRELTCGHCHHAHRFGPCDPPCMCPPHPLDDDVEP